MLGQAFSRGQSSLVLCNRRGNYGREVLLLACGQMAHQDQNTGACSDHQPALTFCRGHQKRLFDLFCSLLAAGQQSVGPAASTGSALRGTLSVGAENGRVCLMGGRRTRVLGGGGSSCSGSPAPSGARQRGRGLLACAELI